MITQINDSAFAGNKNLEKITIPSSVKAIGENVFSNCTNLKEVVFEENFNITSICDGTFYGCSSLTSINLGNLKVLETIGKNVFGSVKVASFVLPASLKSIGTGAFMYAEIAEFALTGTSENFVIEDGVLYYTSDDKKTLISYPGLKQDKMFVCPSDVSEIEAYAFSNVNSDTLKYVYFDHKVDWVIIRNGDGAKVYTSFSGVTGKVKVFASDLSFEIKENVATYKQYSYDIAYNFETQEILFSENFSCDLTKIYFRAFDENTQKTYFVCLELEKEFGEGDEVNYSVKDDSLFLVEVDF